jgi:uncharacterized cofD-like protein
MKKQYMEPVALFCGGHGGAISGRYLKNRASDVTYIVSTFDKGGHSKLLRLRGHGALGDIRRVMEALASDQIMEGVLGDIFSDRFDEIGDSTLNNWALGSLILAALEKKYGYGEGLLRAIEKLSILLQVKGRVLPISLDKADLMSNSTSGIIIRNEGGLDHRPNNARPIMCASLLPTPRICPAADAAIRRAKLIVFLQGSLWGSGLVNTMVGGVPEAIVYAVRHGAKVAMVTNLMMKENEVSIEQNTTAYCVTLLCAHLGLKSIHAVLGNVGAFRPALIKKHASKRSYPVRFEETREAKLNVRGEFAAWNDEGEVWHNSTMADKLLEL